MWGTSELPPEMLLLALWCGRVLCVPQHPLTTSLGRLWSTDELQRQLGEDALGDAEPVSGWKPARAADK